MKENANNVFQRREFLKVGAAGAAVGLGALLGNKLPAQAGVSSDLAAEEIHALPNKIAESYQRFDNRNTLYMRGFWDPPIIRAFMKFMGKFAGMAGAAVTEEAGYTRLDKALRDAGWEFSNKFAMWSGAGFPDTKAYPWKNPTASTQYKFESPADAAKKVKRAARFLGAGLVGIADYDPRWTYSSTMQIEGFTEPRVPGGMALPSGMKHIKVELPFEPRSVVVMAVEMDHGATACSPTHIASAAVGKGYGDMVPLGVGVTKFLTSLGYRTFANGNDTTLSIPYAVAAGLGELGRHGILITKEYGSRVRIVKVFTELELKPDKPRVFGAAEFCRACKRCAETCPSEAISFDEPTMEGETISNNPGVEKWYINPEKCFGFWAANTECGNCVSICPYTKRDMWNHRLIADISAIPGRVSSLHSAMVKMDKLFGFGKTFDEGANAAWWDQE